ncbi:MULTISPECIES: cytochrome c biogenesis protein ResB [Bacillaceae]|uniref:Cytochrome C biogenesis protein n=2 Tax=Bacillaceae TaxID=186817 RepID=A0A9D5HZ29_9BACI|nr:MULTISPECIES: cytochrome c biogenesis protein ResB [Bacillaceae]KQL51789.1 cytochrome C biogenesis protein [Alkalicoccobacillus plakortidis]MBG9784458.1 cytochrome C biogenesis protein [Shouchella lehensis]TES50537.1 cytochrome C biogenesis protein [Shouchella lehensis]
MKDKLKTCECGHIHKEGTDMCAACGKPLTDEAKSEGVNMRYEGAAIRSKKQRRTILDQIWAFFSSVKVGIWIIIILLVASAVGTLFPQENLRPGIEDAATFYEREYGSIGLLYYNLGLNELYSSWWYIALIVALAVSIVVASFDRGIPLYKALKAQRVTRHAHFMTRQRLFAATKASASTSDDLEKVTVALKKKRYTIREENGNLLAEKNRFARWGPYVNHVGLILFLAGCLMRYLPGMYVDTTMWIREGERAPVPEASEYLVENRGFSIDYYDPEDDRFQDAFANSNGLVTESFMTDAVLYKRSGILGDDSIEKVDEKNIFVNDPLKFDSFSLYQTDYRENELHEMTFTLEQKETNETFGELTINLINPEGTYDLGDGYEVRLVNYFPNFYMNSNNEPSTRNNIPDNPYFIFEMITPDTPEGETSVVGIQQNLEPLQENEYKMTFVDVELANVSILTVRKDQTLPLLIAGGSIFIIGLVQGSYWAHRRVWIQQTDGKVWIAGHTNRNWLSFQKELSESLEDTNLLTPMDQEEQKESDGSADVSGQKGDKHA